MKMCGSFLKKKMKYLILCSQLVAKFDFSEKFKTFNSSKTLMYINLLIL